MMHLRAERARGVRRAQHVLALEQAADLRLADGEETKNHGAMRDRLVTGNAHAAPERTRRMGADGNGMLSVGHFSSLPAAAMRDRAA